MATIAAVLTGPTNDGLIEVVWETLTTTIAQALVFS